MNFKIKVITMGSIGICDEYQEFLKPGVALQRVLLEFFGMYIFMYRMDTKPVLVRFYSFQRELEEVGLVQQSMDESFQDIIQEKETSDDTPQLDSIGEFLELADFDETEFLVDFISEKGED